MEQAGTQQRSKQTGNVFDSVSRFSSLGLVAKRHCLCRMHPQILFMRLRSAAARSSRPAAAHQQHTSSQNHNEHPGQWQPAHAGAVCKGVWSMQLHQQHADLMVAGKQLTLLISCCHVAPGEQGGKTRRWRAPLSEVSAGKCQPACRDLALPATQLHTHHNYPPRPVPDRRRATGRTSARGRPPTSPGPQPASSCTIR